MRYICLSMQLVVALVYTFSRFPDISYYSVYVYSYLHLLIRLLKKIV